MTLRSVLALGVLAAAQSDGAPADRAAAKNPGPAIPREMDSAACPVRNSELLRGRSLLYAGRDSEARTVFQSLFENEHRDRSDPVFLACVLNMIALTEARRNRQSPAVAEWLERALTFPSLPVPLSGQITANLASALLDAGRWEEAEHKARTAASLLEKSLGPSAPETLFALGILGSTHLARGDADRAEPVFRRVVKGFASSPGTEAYEYGIASVNLGHVYLLTHRSSQARVMFQQGLVALERSPLKRWPDDVPLARAGLALAFASGHRVRESEKVLESLVPEVEQQLGTSHPTFVVVLEYAARARLLIRDTAAGKRSFDQVLGILETLHGRTSQQVASALQRYRSTLLQANDKRGARLIEARLIREHFVR